MTYILIKNENHMFKRSITERRGIWVVPPHRNFAHSQSLPLSPIDEIMRQILRCT